MHHLHEAFQMTERNLFSRGKIDWHELAAKLFDRLPVFDINTDFQQGDVFADLMVFFAKYLLPQSSLLPENIRNFVSASRDEQELMLSAQLTREDPLGRYLPLYMKRKAQNLIDTYVASLKHLAGALIEESQARFSAYREVNSDVTFSTVIIEVLAQQFMAIDMFERMSSSLLNKSFTEIEEEELVRNNTVLDQITQKIKEIANKRGLNIQTDAKIIHRSIAQIWSMITSNKPIVTPDINYRAYSMQKPGASRSLFAYPHMPRFFHSSPVANYMTYTEIPIVTHTHGHARSFGFLNFINVDSQSGEGYVLERPHYMHSAEIMNMAALVPNGVDRIFSLDALSHKNHDLWHHMVQVFAAHFQIHHDSAPISYDGYKSFYLGFARDMRMYRESYELAAGAGHLDIFTAKDVLGSSTPELDKEMTLIEIAFTAVVEVKNKLLKSGRIKDAQIFVDYICNELFGPEFNVLAFGTSQRQSLEQKILALSPSPRTIQLSDIIALMDGQKLLLISFDQKQEIIDHILNEYPALIHFPNVVNWNIRKENTALTSDKKREYINGAFHDILPYCSKEKLSEIYQSLRRDLVFPQSEYAADVLLETLDELNLLVAADMFPVHLTGVATVRWHCLAGEIQPALKGMSEKIHHIKGVPYGDQSIVTLFDLAVLQQHTLDVDAEEYAFRVMLRTHMQRSTHALLGMFSQTHISELNDLPVRLSNAYNQANEKDKRKIADILVMLDRLVDNIFCGIAYPLSHKEIAAFDKLKQILGADSSHRIDEARNQYVELSHFSHKFRLENSGKTSKPGHMVVSPSRPNALLCKNIFTHYRDSRPDC